MYSCKCSCQFAHISRSFVLGYCLNPVFKSFFFLCSCRMPVTFCSLAVITFLYSFTVSCSFPFLSLSLAYDTKSIADMNFFPVTHSDNVSLVIYFLSYKYVTNFLYPWPHNYFILLVVSLSYIVPTSLSGNFYNPWSILLVYLCRHY